MIFLPSKFFITGEMNNEYYDIDGMWLDCYGLWIWAICNHINLIQQPWIKEKYRESLELIEKYIRTLWKFPCYDCWDENYEQEGLDTSTLLAVHGGLKAVGLLLNNKKSIDVANEIISYILKNCVSENRLVKSTENNNIDASLLWSIVPLEIFGRDEPLIINTVEELTKKLVSGATVKRYYEDTYYGGGDWVMLSG